MSIALLLRKAIGVSTRREHVQQRGDKSNGLWAYRGFILASVKREFQLQYRNSLLGVVWSIINPLCMIFIYTVVFSHVMRARLPGVDHSFAYSIYLCAGIIPWFFFAEVMNRSLKVFLDNANLIKKLHFPMACLPVIVIAGSMINFAIILGLFMLFLVWSGTFPGVVIFATLFVLTIQVMFSMGLGILLGILNVFFRDVGQFFIVFVQIWFWLTPIVYTKSILPDWIKPVFHLNPMCSLVEGYHDIFVYQRWPGGAGLWWTALIALLVCLLAVRSYRKHREEIVDEL